jgi:hypothetical protein
VLSKDKETLDGALNGMERLSDSTLNRMKRLLMVLSKDRETYMEVHSDL